MGVPGDLAVVGAALERGVQRRLEDRDDAVGVVDLRVRLADEPRLARIGDWHRAPLQHLGGHRVVELVVGVGPASAVGRQRLGRT